MTKYEKQVDTGEKASMQVTTVQDCVQTLVTLEPLDFFKETFGRYPLLGQLKPCLCDQIRYFRSKWSFPQSNRTKSTVLSQEKNKQNSNWLKNKQVSFCKNHREVKTSYDATLCIFKLNSIFFLWFRHKKHLIRIRNIVGFALNTSLVTINLAGNHNPPPPYTKVF